MKRVHLFELEDQPWLPTVVRDSMTDYLGFVANLSDVVFRGIAKKLAAALDRTHDTNIVEMGSGGGGPAIPVSRQIKHLGHAHLKLVLTDLYPNVERLRAIKVKCDVPIEVIETPVNATDVPPTLRGFRLMCNAFHHLPPNLAQGVLADAAQQGQGIAIIEMVNRSLAGFANLLLGMVMLPFLTPFLRPFRMSRLVLTYLLPVIPLCILWDGIVSCPRVYSPDELRELIAGLPENDHHWEVGYLSGEMPLVKITYLVGVPNGAPGR